MNINVQDNINQSFKVIEDILNSINNIKTDKYENNFKISLIYSLTD